MFYLIFSAPAQTPAIPPPQQNSSKNFADQYHA